MQNRFNNYAFWEIVFNMFLDLVKNGSPDESDVNTNGIEGRGSGNVTNKKHCKNNKSERT